ncbi:Csm1 multi-domain protein [Pyrenophora teres f. maculata]|nr:Csm1 multi-domain protein [Pyrenophora teres f. maculata]
MPPRSKVANISFTVDSASEDEMTVDELNALPTPESNSENKAPARKARGTAAQAKKAALTTKATAKGRPATRRVSGSSVVVMKKTGAGVKKAPAKGRKALIERKEKNASDTEEVEEFEEEEVAAPVKPAKRGRPAKKAQEEEEPVEEVAPAPAKRGRKAAVKEPAAKKETKTKTAAKSKRAPETEPEPEQMTIPETQPESDADPMDISETIEVEEIPESMPPPLPSRPSARRTQAKPNSRARRASAGVRRTGSVSDSERDPVMRRKVGDLTRKLDSMTSKYETLREAASSGKESNFDQLKKRTDQIAKDQDAIITALKNQITTLQSRTSTLPTLKQELLSASKESLRLATENKKLTDALATAHSENKALSSKLSAARASSQQQDTAKAVPGSAMKPRTTGVVLPGTAEAAREAALAKQKVDLYSDLTNLVVLGVRRNDEDADVYDCIQTGRNGTLHFHLTVATPSSTSSSYEDTEFVYQPLLNQQRDRELLDLLPDYLTEEICFPRGQAAKFYCKVVDSMSKKVEIVEDDDEDTGVDVEEGATDGDVEGVTEGSELVG